MTPEQATSYLLQIKVSGESVSATVATHAPDSVWQALREVRSAVLLLNQAAAKAGCVEPLHILVREFRQDLEAMATGRYPIETVADAITIIAPGYGWAIERSNAV